MIKEKLLTIKRHSFITSFVASLIFFVNTLNAQSPSISAFFPDSGSTGTLITIVGTNLGSPTGFTVGSVNAIIVSDSAVMASNKGDTLVGLVMPGSFTGAISVTTGNGTATSSGNFTVTQTHFPALQQGSKLVGTGAEGAAIQGISVSISADGNTAIVGGYDDDSGDGAAWIYTRSTGVWTQQGNKLVGTGAINGSNGAQQGISVSLSADGNTAIVGGYGDNSNAGAAWVYVRSNGVWTQQGNKLVGTGAIGDSDQGYSVSISADGNTAIVGGCVDNSKAGAAWIYTRSAGIWTQQGNKLVGTGAIGNAYQGWSVAISADGNTAIVGGYTDNQDTGAVWIYTRSAGVWTQQGDKLVGTGGAGNAYQGGSVSISADGNTAIVGGSIDNNGAGAAWVYFRSTGVWTQQGEKLVGTGAIYGTFGAQQGISVSLCADGNTAIVGGFVDNSNNGAVWIFTRTAGVWTQQGNKLAGTGATVDANQGYSVSISADGNTAIIGGVGDNSNNGAAWIFVSSAGYTGVSEIQSTPQDLSIYPNPTSSTVNYSISGTTPASAKLSIFDMLGRMISTEAIQLRSGTNSFSKNVSEFGPGIYFLQVLSIDGMNVQKKFVVK